MEERATKAEQDEIRQFANDERSFKWDDKKGKETSCMANHVQKIGERCPPHVKDVGRHQLVTRTRRKRTSGEQSCGTEERKQKEKRTKERCQANMEQAEKSDSRSRFFALWRFLLGLLITLIGLLVKVPKWCSSIRSPCCVETLILTRASTRFLRSSTSLMYNCLPTHRPMRAGWG